MKNVDWLAKNVKKLKPKKAKTFELELLNHLNGDLKVSKINMKWELISLISILLKLDGVIWHQLWIFALIE